MRGLRLTECEQGNPVCIVSGAFAGLTCNIGPGSGNTPHCLSRAVDESLTAQCNSGFVQTCNSRGDYASLESCSEGGYAHSHPPPLLLLYKNHSH
jgi:tyrosinase